MIVYKGTKKKGERKKTKIGPYKKGPGKKKKGAGKRKEYSGKMKP